MRCPYPDCTGEVTADEPFCGECGRSLAPTAVAAAKAGLALTGAALLAPPPAAPGPGAGAPPRPYSPPPARPAPIAPARSSRLPWLLGGAVGAVLLSIACCLGSLAWIGANVPLTPTVSGPEVHTIHFTLADLTQANGYKAVREIQAPDGSTLGTVALNANYTYEQLGAAELIGTVELRVNNSVVLELAASNEPEYAASNPQFKVAQPGQTYTATGADGWQVSATVSALAINDKPALGQGGVGKQPIFDALALDVTLTPPAP